jgi:RND family efflux transporter MFP subunit
LEKLKAQQKEVGDKITKLEEQLGKLDTSLAKKEKVKLVTLETIDTSVFTHFIDLQGKIDAQNVAMVAPQGQGGVVKAIYIKQGSVVKKGQLLLKLDGALQQEALATAQQAISGAKAQLTLAQTTYERYKNLWAQNIGSEIQVLKAKADAEAAESQYNVAKASVSQAQAQLNTTNVYADISGTIDVVNVRIGEFFSPQTASNALTGIRIVNTSDLKVLVQVPENYLERVKTGSTLKITLPEANNKEIITSVSAAGRFIDPSTRTFFVEGKVPQDKDIHANQIAQVRIQDYTNKNAITIPVNTLQNDEIGKFVLVAVKEGDRLVARKRPVQTGELYGERLEVKSGLKNGEVLITDGFQSVYDGQAVTTGTGK